MRAITLFVMVVFLFAVVSIANPVSAQVQQSGETGVIAGMIIDPADLEAFLDGAVKSRMDSFHVAGVTLSVVYDGKILLIKGYGYADVESRTQVDPAVTLFRPGSISKTFTWTAVMQLVEQGKLELDEDIRTYLKDVEIPDIYPEPITMSDLMAHTPGFEDAIFGHIFGDDPNAVYSLKEYLQKFQPVQVRPPGEKLAYSNYGCALAGHIVAVVSGVPYEDYVEQNILGPLGMTHSTFREPWKNLDMDPMPAYLLKQSSTAYAWENGRYEPKPFEFIHHQGPAGALSSTATDMARWMLMHLGDGTLDGVRIIAPETARLMHTRHFSHGEEFDGFAHGFVEGRIGPYRTIGHSGGSLYFMSQMVMVPELGFGLFASSNTSDGMSVVADLPDLVVKRCFPTGDIPADLQPSSHFVERANEFTGVYLNPRRSYTMVEKIYGVIANAAKVTVSDDGCLVLNGGGVVLRFAETAPLTFREVDGEVILKFVEDENGKITGMIIKGNYLDRAGCFDSVSTIISITVLALLVCLGILIAAWYRRKLQITQTTGEKFANGILVTTSALWLLFFAVFLLALAGMKGPSDVIFHFPSSVLVLALVIALVAVIFTLSSIILLYPVWVKRSWSLGRQIRHTVAVLILAVMGLMMNSLNMIGFKYF